MEIPKAGFIIVNKPTGPTSHDIIDKLRGITGVKKIGHAGTLDPFASGVLIVAIGRSATHEIHKYVKLDKKYIAILRLGRTTDTYDKTGKITNEYSGPPIPGELIEKTIQSFKGKQKQVPPMFSAKKIKGKKLYELARIGIEVERKPVDIEIYDIKLLDYKWPYATIKIHSSSGTYMRSLGYDIGEKLGCGAYLEGLERVAVGKYVINNAVKI